MKQKLIFNGETLEVNGTLLSHYGIGDGSCLQVVIQVGWIIRVSDLHNPGRVLEVFLKGHNPEVSIGYHPVWRVLWVYNTREKSGRGRSPRPLFSRVLYTHNTRQTG